MASPRGGFIVETAKHNGPMKQKDWHLLIFRLYTLKANTHPRLRSVTGRSVVRWKTKRKTEWEKRISRTTAEESGEAADSEERDEE